MPQRPPAQSEPAPSVSETSIAEPAEPPTEPADAPAAVPEPPQADVAVSETNAATPPQPQQVDRGNWLCTAWLETDGDVVTTGTANNETCTQWTVKRGAAQE